jgi:mono/diheme cytochrome c family protein
MRHVSLAVYLAALILPLAGPTVAHAAGADSAALSIKRGHAMAVEKCASCHAVELSGASPYPPAPAWRELVVGYDVDALAEAFAEGIFVGHDGPTQMPEFMFTPDEIDDLLNYMKSLQPA